MIKSWQQRWWKRPRKEDTAGKMSRLSQSVMPRIDVVAIIIGWLDDDDCDGKKGDSTWKEGTGYYPWRR
jgi:hypothetical protein